MKCYGRCVYNRERERQGRDGLSSLWSYAQEGSFMCRWSRLLNQLRSGEYHRLEVAAQDWPTLDAPGARVAWHVDARGVGVAATLAVHDWDGRLLARRTYDGQWEVGGAVTWTPGRSK
jgi:hypothetical protein